MQAIKSFYKFPAIQSIARIVHSSFEKMSITKLQKSNDNKPLILDPLLSVRFSLIIVQFSSEI